MNAFQEAKSAVAKVMKDYQPLVNLAEVLEKVEKVVLEIGELDKVRTQLVADITRLKSERSAAQAEKTQADQAADRARALYEDIKAKLDAFKG